MWVIAASLPPVTITSAQPAWMSLKASPIALAAEAQAVATAEHGPCRPQRIETWPLAALTISLGITNGLIRDGPFCIITVCWVSNSLSPPIPEPMITPQCSAGSVAKSIPESSTAEIAAAMANCANRSRCRASLTPNRADGVPVADLAAELDLELGGVEERQRPDAALARAERRPEPVQAVAQRRDHPHAGDDDAAWMCHDC